MSDTNALMRVRRFFGGTLRSTTMPAMSVIGFVVMLTAVQVAFAAPSPP